MFQVYEKNSDESSLIGRYCGDSLPAPISSNGNEIYLVFQTNMTNDNVGFQIYYEASKHILILYKLLFKNIVYSSLWRSI